MGEIGRDRHEYLYEMSYCDILLIQRGYRRRNILQYQLQRLQAYGSFHCMAKDAKPPQDWLPLYIDHYIMEDMEPAITQEEQDELQALMEAENARLEAERNK